MDGAEIFKLVAEYARSVGVGAATHTLEIAGLSISAILGAMKAYRYGRDRILTKVKHFIIAEEGFWNRKPGINIPRHIKELESGLPIVTVVNFKGGVGKTTIAANLAAYYDSIGLRVLAIDFDYQGSLTDCMVRTDENLKIGAADLLNEALSTPRILDRVQKAVADFHSTNIFAAAYSLSSAENKAVFNWLVGDTKTDLRFNLHRVLKSPEVRKAYDIVIIDAPPRLMMATVNALCASTHVIVPTILDGSSTRATIHTVDAIEKMAENVSPTLRIAGIVPTFVEIQTRYQPREAVNLAYLRQQLSERVQDTHRERIHIFEAERILDRAAIAKAAGDRVAYFDNSEVNGMFSALGFELAKSLGKTFMNKVHDESHRPKAELGTPPPIAGAVGR